MLKAPEREFRRPISYTVTGEVAEAIPRCASDRGRGKQARGYARSRHLHAQPIQGSVKGGSSI